MEFLAACDIFSKDIGDLEPLLFKSESDLCDFIEHNIESASVDFFGEELLEYQREYPLPLGFNKGSLRVDFMIRTGSNQYLCEVKNPTHYAELRNAIGQLLQYKIHMPDAIACLITTKYDDVLHQIINHWQLPIHVYVMTRGSILKLLHDG